MTENQSVNIRRISRNRAEQIGYYRFLNNENVKQSELSRSLSEACQQQVEGQQVLAISDTTEINLTTHVGRLKYEELRVVGNDTDLVFFLPTFRRLVKPINNIFGRSTFCLGRRFCFFD